MLRKFTLYFLMLRIALVFLLVFPLSAWAFPMGDLRITLEDEIESQTGGDKISITRARVIVGEKRYSINRLPQDVFKDDMFLNSLEVKESINSFTAEITSDDEQSIFISGRYGQMTELPVLENNISRGQVIKEADIKYIYVAQNSARNALKDVSEIIGKVAGRNIRSGKAINKRDVKRRLLVKKGAIVSVIYQTKYMQLRTAAKATQNAVAGEVIALKNTKSGAIIQAMISPKGEAIVNYIDYL